MCAQAGEFEHRRWRPPFVLLGAALIVLPLGCDLRCGSCEGDTDLVARRRQLEVLIQGIQEMLEATDQPEERAKLVEERGVALEELRRIEEIIGPSGRDFGRPAEEDGLDDDDRERRDGEVGPFSR